MLTDYREEDFCRTPASFWIFPDRNGKDVAAYYRPTRGLGQNVPSHAEKDIWHGIMMLVFLSGKREGSEWFLKLQDCLFCIYPATDGTSCTDIQIHPFRSSAKNACRLRSWNECSFSRHWNWHCSACSVYKRLHRGTSLLERIKQDFASFIFLSAFVFRWQAPFKYLPEIQQILTSNQK